MATIIIILLATVLIPFVAPQRHKNNAMLVAWALLFFVWAFQYHMSADWVTYVNRWKGAINNVMAETRAIEPVYKAIMQFCEPIGFFGYLILCALFSVCVLKMYVDKYLPPAIKWIFFLTFSFGLTYSLEFIDTNRQTMAIMFVMLAVYLLSNQYVLNKRRKYWIISWGLVIAAFFTHTSAIISVPIMFFPFFVTKEINYKFLYVLLGINLFSFFVDFSALSSIVGTYMEAEGSLEGFAQYSTEIDERSKSFIEQGIFSTTLFLLIYNYEKFKKNEKMLVLSSMVFLALQGYVMYTMLRVLSYYRIFFAYAIPLLYLRCDNGKKSYKWIANSLLAAYAAYMIFRFSVDIYGPNYVGYNPFKTIFDAHVWM